MNKKDKIRSLRKKGLTIRQIQKRLGISSPSVVQYHLKPTRFDNLIFPERHPRVNDKKSEYMCAGFNEYRKMLIKAINNN
jgi:hypothetical protein